MYASKSFKYLDLYNFFYLKPKNVKTSNIGKQARIYYQNNYYA